MTQAAQQDVRLFFDITSVIEYIEKMQRYSGIQRVVTSLLASIRQTPQVDRCFLSFIDRASGVAQYIPLSDLSPEILLSPAKMRIFFFPSLPIPDDIKFLERYREKPAKYLFHRTRLDVAMFMGNESPFKRFNMTLAQWRTLRFGDRATIDAKPFRPKPLETLMARGDHLVLLDSSWLDWQIQAFTALRKAGLVVTTLVYDLIPIEVPGSTDQGLAAVFHDWLLSSTDYTDNYMAISKSAREDLLRFLHVYGKSQEVTVLALTQTALATIKPEPTDVGPMHERIDPAHYSKLIDAVTLDHKIAMLASTPFVLCVGTIEFRKNGWRLAMAWKKLIDEGHVDIPRLVFAGRRGWLSQNLFDLLDGTGNLYGYVTVLEGPSDKELDFLYRNCTFAAMPSLYEGWGLPVGEALSYGKTSVVSNTTSLPEVGLDLVEYCNPESIESIASAVLRLSAEPGRRNELEAKIKVAKLRNWSDVAQDLFLILA